MHRCTSALLALFAISTISLARADTPGHVPTQPYRWKNVTMGGGGGFITGIVFNPTHADVAYVRTDIGGSYRLDAKRRRWIAMTDWVGQANGNLRGAESIAIDPTNPNRVYLAAGTYSRNTPSAILRSSDQGRTWQESIVPLEMGANENGRNIGERLAVDPNTPSVLYFGSRHNGLWRSTDGAVTWSQVTSFPAVPDPAPAPFVFGGGGGPVQAGSAGVGIVVFDPRSKAAGKATQTIYAFIDSPKADASIYRSTDGGATWSALAGQPPPAMEPEHAALTTDGILYVAYGNNVGPNGITDGAVWKYDTGSGAWTDITPVKPTPDVPGGYSGVAIDPTHAGTVMVSTLDHWGNPHDEIYRSLDFGAHWTPVSPTADRDSGKAPWLDLLQLSPVPDGTRPKPHFGWWTSALALDPFHPDRAYYGTGATIWGTDDIRDLDSGKPTHWRMAADGVEETAVICLISPAAGPHLISGVADIGGFTHENLDVSPPEGLSSTPIFTTTSSLDFAQSAPRIVVRAGSGSHGTTQYGAYSTDGGASWKAFPTQPAGTRGSGSLVVTADGKTIVWASNGAATAYTRDFGATWTACTGLPAPPAGGRRFAFGGGVQTTLAADRVNPSKVYAFNTQSSATYISTDGGATYVRLVNDLPSQAGSLFASPAGDGDLWVAQGAHGLYHSVDGGATFTAAAGLPEANTLGFGAPAPGQTYPALYAVGSVSGIHGVYRSDDKGATWIRINDDQHQYGWIGQHPIAGDPRVYGRVYLATDGRGIVYADPAGPVVD